MSFERCPGRDDGLGHHYIIPKTELDTFDLVCRSCDKPRSVTHVLKREASGWTNNSRRAREKPNTSPGKKKPTSPK